MAENQLRHPMERLHFYWTGEPNSERTLLTVDNSRELRVSVAGQTTSTAQRIQARDCEVCDGCKLIDLCRADGTLR